MAAPCHHAGDPCGGIDAFMTHKDLKFYIKELRSKGYKEMTEGTKSYLFGCHQFFFHPLWVLLAWRKHFGRWPAWWQVICIFLHDIGICGRNYLSGSKDGHWRLGAKWSAKIVWWLTPQREKEGLAESSWRRAFLLCAGHTTESRYFPKSDLFWADKKSWLVAPLWWLWWNFWIEGFGTKYGVTAPQEWRQMVRANLATVEPKGSHQLFVENYKRNGL